MSNKRKDRSEAEYLKGIIRSLEKRVGQLTRDLSRAEKELAKRYDSRPGNDDREADSPPNAELPLKREHNKAHCPSCQSVLETTDLGIRKLIRCSSCSYRRSEKS